MTGTRVFCIGLSRTGTTSLHLAGLLLGYSVIHYPSVLSKRWMLGDFSENAVGPFNFYSDLPLPVYYKQMDRSYPGSKFILTMRDPEEWIESVESYMKKTKPISSSTLQRDITRLMVYGIANFHKDIYMDAYERHIDDVLKYFQDRPSDLLNMDLKKEQDPWVPLCRFLGKDVPADEFPNIRWPDLGELKFVLPDELAQKRKLLKDTLASHEPGTPLWGWRRQGPAP